MRERARASVGASSLLRLAGAGLLLGTLLAFDCGPPPPPPPPPPGPNEVKTIDDFVACVNDRLKGKQDASVADTVQCLPPKCCITLTMSQRSAQAACTLGGDGDPEPVCQLPRVLIECPGPPKLMPSYLLCPVGSETGPEGMQVRGSNRVEVGQAVDDQGNMRMADIPINPGLFKALTGDVISHTKDGSDAGTHGCNDDSIGCHTAEDPLESAPNEQLPGASTRSWTPPRASSPRTAAIRPRSPASAPARLGAAGAHRCTRSLWPRSANASKTLA